MKPAPVIVAALTVTAAVPVELSVNVCVVAEVIMTLPKLKLPALTVSCGLGGPAGTPSVCRNAKLTGSMQLSLQVPNPNVQDRLSIVNAAHHLFASQLGASMNGMNPGG